jgi:hypothetical protein
MALVYAWNKDFSLKEREQANQVRDAASKTLAKLERRKELSLWIFEDIQPLIVESSEHLKNSKDLAETRDFLWKGVNAARFRIRQRIVEENIESAYVPLFSYFPRTKENIDKVADDLNKLENTMYINLLFQFEKIVFSYRDRLDTFQTGMLGNDLRRIVESIAGPYQENMQNTTAGLEEDLFRIVTTPDQDLTVK